MPCERLTPSTMRREAGWVPGWESSAASTSLLPEYTDFCLMDLAVTVTCELLTPSITPLMPKRRRSWMLPGLLTKLRSWDRGGG